MRYWEYRYVFFKIARERGMELCVFSIDGKFVEDWEQSKSQGITQYSNSLGQQGWELAFYEPSMNSSVPTNGIQVTAVNAVFKRSIE